MHNISYLTEEKKYIIKPIFGRGSKNIFLIKSKKEAIKLKNRHKFIAGNTMPALFSEFREKPETIQKELKTLKRVVSKLLFTPIEDGVKTRDDALYIFGFSNKITPPQISVSRRYKELASIYHPDTALGSHSRMTQINQAYQILKN